MTPGLCGCGCGGVTPLAPYCHKGRGWTRGEPIRFIYGHFARTTIKQTYTVDPVTGCWLYDGFVSDKGYPGQVWGIDGKKAAAHVVFYERKHGPVPPGFQLDHLCRVRRCVNPDHLEPVPCAINVRRGLLAKLTAADVAIIRAAGGATTTELVAAFGVSPSTIREIRNSRRTWREIGHAA